MFYFSDSADSPKTIFHQTDAFDVHWDDAVVLPRCCHGDKVITIPEPMGTGKDTLRFTAHHNGCSGIMPNDYRSTAFD